MVQMRHKKFARSLACAGIFATLLLFAGRAGAQTAVQWTTTAVGSFTTGTNWIGGTAPGASSIATFSVAPTSATTPVTLPSGTTSVGALSVLSGRTNGLVLDNAGGVNAILQLNGETINSYANTIISDATPYASTSVIDSIGNWRGALHGSLGISVNTSGGAYILGSGIGSTTKAGNTIYINSPITTSTSQPLTYLGGGTIDLLNNPTGYNGGLLELSGRNSAMLGGLTIGDANLNGVPDWGNSGNVTIDSATALPSTGTYTITVNNNSILFLTNTAAMNFSNPNCTIVIHGGGDGVNSGALRMKSTGGITYAGKVVVGSDGAVITDASGGDIYTYTGPITGSGQLQFQGAGTSSLTASGNTWGSTQIGNGLVIVTSTGSFSQGALNYDNTSTNTIGVTFNQPTQTIAGLYNISSATAGSYSLTLNSNALTINQPAGTSDCRGSSTIPFYVLGNGSINYNGPGTLILGTTGSNLSGGITVNSGNLYLAPFVGTNCVMNSPVTLTGGVFGTTNIGAGAAVSVNALTMSGSATLALDGTSAHTITFANSSSATWTGTLTVTGWVGSTGVYSTSAGASGTKGQIFFGNNASGLTAAQLAQIQFYDGTNYYPATILSTGELVPAPSITTTAASFGPFCNGINNSFSVGFTTAGTLTGTYSVQLSNASGSFSSPTIIGTGSSSPISASIPSGTGAGTGYRIRVVNSAPAINGSDNGSNITEIAAPTAYTLTGSGAICPGSAGVDIQLSGSQSGVDYQLYNGASTVGGFRTASGAAIDFGAQTVAGTYTVLATSTGTGACTQVMTGSGSVTVNPIPGISISGTTLITPGNTATLLISDTSTYNTGSGDVAVMTDGVSTYSVTMSHGSNEFITPSLSTTTTYNVTSAYTTLGCTVTVTGQAAVVYVSATPTAIITGGTTICPASQGGAADLTFTGTASGVVNYTDGVSTYSVTLSAGSGGVGTADIIVTPSVATTYSLISIVSSGTYTLSGSATVNISALPTVYSMTGGAYCAGTSGANVGLSGSDNSSVSYQLYDGTGTPWGSAVPGTGSAISFGVYSAVATTYTVLATNSLGCYDVMAGSSTIVENPLPTAYSVTGTGNYCVSGSGIPVGLSNSDNSGTTYQLYEGATTIGSPVAGTSASFNFGSAYTVGVYTVLATITSTGCTNAMTGSAIITTVSPLSAGSISGPSVINISGSMTLSDPTAVGGGTWSSTNTSTATIGSTGVLTAVAAGTTTVSYTTSNVCGPVAATSVVTVNATTTGEVVMSQVYGGGGGTGATYKNQFVELFNPSGNAITMTNWSIQFGTSPSVWTSNTFSGTIAAHSYFLIELSGGPTGATLPTPDYTGTLVMNKTNGIVALVANGNTISSISSGSVTSLLATDNIVDFVGYGSGASYLSSDAAPSGTSASLSIFRGLNGCINTYNNGSDFSTGVPSARNSASGTNICPVPTAYYSKSTGNLDVTSTWGTNTDGSGSNPPDFATPEETFHIANGNTGVTSGAWTISGVGSSLNVDDATDFAITTNAVNATVNVGAGRTLTISNSTLPSLSSLDPASTVTYSGYTGLSITSASYGNLTLLNTTVTNSTGATLSVAGNLTLSGTSGMNLLSTTALSMNGSTDQVISAPSGDTVSVNAFTANKSTGNLSLATGTNLTIYGSCTMVFNGGSTNAFTDNGNVLTIGHAVDLSGPASAYNFTGTLVLYAPAAAAYGAQNILGTQNGVPNGGTNYPCYAVFNNMLLTGTSPVAFNGGSGAHKDTIYVRGNLYISSQAAGTGYLKFHQTTIGPGNTIAVGGNFSDSTTSDFVYPGMDLAGSTLMFYGSGNQTYYSAVPGGNEFRSITMNKTGGSLNMLSSISIADSLTMLGGVINTGSNKVTILAAGNVYSANSASYINGNLVETVHSGGVSSLFFPVGDATYAPVNLAYGATVTGGSVQVSSTSGAYSQAATSYLNASNYVNRYWTITDNGTSASSTTVNVGLDYNAGDMTGSGNSGYSIREYTTGWATMPSIVNLTSGVSPLPANSSTSTGISGSSYSGNYMAGLPDCTGATGGTANASATAICGSGTSNISLAGSSSGTGITYQWQSSATGSGYTTISGATNATYATPTLSSTTYYNCVVGCLFTSTTATSAAVAVSVNALPTVSAISGTQNVCIGSSTSLSDVTSDVTNVWSSGNTSVANVNSSTGSVTGVSAGTATISYTETNASSCSSFVTAVVTVNALPVVSPISGGTSVCVGSTITLTDATGSGTWSASGNANVDGSGDVNGVSTGSGTVTYSVTNVSGCTTIVTTNITVNALPTVSGILGASNVCVGSSIALSDATSGVTNSWSSSNTSNATVNSSTGTVTGALAGTTSITYTVTNVNGCSNTATTTVTINPIPGAIMGNTPVCVGFTINLSDAVTGGSWSTLSSNVSLAGPVVTGSTAGSAVVTYTLPAGCYTTALVTVNVQPVAISGLETVCSGSTIRLSDLTSGGTWSSSNTAAATIGSAGSPVTVTGQSEGGTTTISYVTGTGCSTSVVVTVNQLPVISGSSPVCIGQVTNLTDNITGGTWTSVNTAKATVGSAGNVTGIAAGTSTISYVDLLGCANSIVVTVNASPVAISGGNLVCLGSTLSLSDATAGGSWTASGSVSLTGSAGNVLGASAGTGSVTYSLGTGCSVTTNVNVANPPTTISGGNAICAGNTEQLSDGVNGGTWTSSTIAIATIGSTSGLLTSVTQGTTNITYSTAPGCSITTMVSVNAISQITGGNTVCLGTSITLQDLSGGGTWSTSSTALTVVGSTGLVTALAVDTATVIYTIPSGCSRGVVLTINPPTTPISGNLSICESGTTSLSDNSTGGTWSMSSLDATINGSTGVVTGSSSYTGTATVSYTAGPGCVATAVLTVNANPKSIQSAGIECAGNTISLSDATTGGTWSATGSATASGAGTSGTLVAGSVAGTATVVYTLPTGCFVTALNTIAANPTAILGTTTVCVGGQTILSDLSSPAQSWSSSNTAVASAAGGDISGISVGSAMITYSILPAIGSTGTGCSVVTTVNVVSPGAGISGNTGAVCPGSTMSLTAGTGTWTSSNTLVASVGTNGVVTGVSGGNATITFLPTGSSGCMSTTAVTVSAVPTVGGNGVICPGGTTALTDVVLGGTWSSGSTTIATVAATGVVTGVAGGNAVITYTAATGCRGTLTVTVNGVSATINGNLAMCNGTSTTLSDASVGGTWSMSSSLASVVGSTGVVTANATLTGTATVSYTSGSCSATAIVTVNVKPAAIQGIVLACANSTISLTDVTTGGTWSVTGDATITGTGAAATYVTGSIGGTAIVTYTAPTGCIATVASTIYAAPQPIMGNFNMCVGTVTDLSDASPVSSWTSSNTAIAIASGADISGEGVGTATITFKSSAAGNCITTQVVTVSAMPVVTPINGPATISHANPSVTISDATAGGVWTSSNTTIIALSGSTGSPIGATALTTAGSSVITYAVTISGCTTKVTRTFAASTASHPDASTTTIYAGSAVSLVSDLNGGSWSSSDNGIATVDMNGLVTGIMPGSVSITHEISGNDGIVATEVSNVVVASAPISISLLPNPNKGTFTVRGTLGSNASEEVTLEVTDLLGQVIYRSNATSQDGKLNETISLSNALSNGMYILNVQSTTGHSTIHFVIAQ